jgi:hypothetical protein
MPTNVAIAPKYVFSEIFQLLLHMLSKKTGKRYGISKNEITIIAIPKTVFSTVPFQNWTPINKNMLTVKRLANSKIIVRICDGFFSTGLGANGGNKFNLPPLNYQITL